MIYREHELNYEPNYLRTIFDTFAASFYIWQIGLGMRFNEFWKRQNWKCSTHLFRSALISQKLSKHPLHPVAHSVDLFGNPAVPLDRLPYLPGTAVVQFAAFVVEEFLQLVHIDGNFLAINDRSSIHLGYKSNFLLTEKNLSKRWDSLKTYSTYPAPDSRPPGTPPPAPVES